MKGCPRDGRGIHRGRGEATGPSGELVKAAVGRSHVVPPGMSPQPGQLVWLLVLPRPRRRAPLKLHGVRSWPSRWRPGDRAHGACGAAEPHPQERRGDSSSHRVSGTHVHYLLSSSKRAMNLKGREQRLLRLAQPWTHPCTGSSQHIPAE